MWRAKHQAFLFLHSNPNPCSVLCNPSYSSSLQSIANSSFKMKNNSPHGPLRCVCCSLATASILWMLLISMSPLYTRGVAGVRPLSFLGWSLCCSVQYLCTNYRFLELFPAVWCSHFRDHTILSVSFSLFIIGWNALLPSHSGTFPVCCAGFAVINKLIIFHELHFS